MSNCKLVWSYFVGWVVFSFWFKIVYRNVIWVKRIIVLFRYYVYFCYVWLRRSVCDVWWNFCFE